ncbi:uncharacterized protein TM35_000231040 [Trypanosoma theileri]|uniref:Uncharacterized protein n=1 Tax=Trypanosoma theileri TaxID=67003 RepID=A0A1X0NRM1_9TRYP|nr:uncharacterized protein TM35_000231040 [Trypanosoma theileri]ORC87133.1 hypothetical protein TM35_000231040 [Trypanosoma theileri]
MEPKNVKPHCLHCPCWPGRRRRQTARGEKPEPVDGAGLPHAPLSRPAGKDPGPREPRHEVKKEKFGFWSPLYIGHRQNHVGCRSPCGSMEEHLTTDQRVAGSSPVTDVFRSQKNPSFIGGFFFCFFFFFFWPSGGKRGHPRSFSSHSALRNQGADTTRMLNAKATSKGMGGRTTAAWFAVVFLFSCASKEPQQPLPGTAPAARAASGGTLPNPNPFFFFSNTRSGRKG